MNSGNDNLKSKKNRRQRNRDRTKQEIIETARAIMREKGVAALSMQELARQLGMRAPSLYNYYKGLMDIYDALFRQGFLLWGEHLKTYTQETTTWQDEIRMSMTAYLTFAKQNPELYQLCFERPVPGFEPSPESMQVSQRLLQRGYKRIAELHDQMNTALPPDRITDLMIAIMHGITAQHMANEPNSPMGAGRFGGLIPDVIEILEKAFGSTTNQ